VLAKGKKLGNIYILECHGKVGAAMIVVDKNSKIWHKRFMHMSKKVLEVMLQRGQLPRLKSVDLELCEDCLYGK
jgi:hypothetical protein